MRFANREAAHRIAIEAMTNAFNHSQGTRIELSISYAQKYFVIRVADNGRGFDPRRSYSGHWGLIGMRERADRLHARLRVGSEGHGSVVTLEIPAGIAYI